MSSFEAATLERVGRLAPPWPRWLNAVDLAPETIGAGGADRVPRDLRRSGGPIDARSIARAQAAGLEVAAWTVRRRPTYARLERLGVVAICVEAAALDG